MMSIAGQKEKLEEPYQDTDTVGHQQYSKPFRKKAGLVHQITEREEPCAVKNLGYGKAAFVKVEKQQIQGIKLIGLESLLEIRTAINQHRGKQVQQTEALYGNPCCIEQKEQQGEVLVNRLQKDVEGPGRQEEQNGGDQIVDKTDTKQPH